MISPTTFSGTGGRPRSASATACALTLAPNCRQWRWPGSRSCRCGSAPGAAVRLAGAGPRSSFRVARGGRPGDAAGLFAVADNDPVPDGTDAGPRRLALESARGGSYPSCPNLRHDWAVSAAAWPLHSHGMPAAERTSLASAPATPLSELSREMAGLASSLGRMSRRCGCRQRRSRTHPSGNAHRIAQGHTVSRRGESLAR